MFTPVVTAAIGIFHPFVRSSGEPHPTDMTATTETATLGGGCFWCLEAVFEQLRGVESVVSGYAGGHVAEPDLRAGLRQEHRPRRGRAGRRSTRRGLVPRGAGGVLRHPRPDDAQPPGQRRRPAVPLGDLHPLRGTAEDRRGADRRADRGESLRESRSSPRWRRSPSSTPPRATTRGTTAATRRSRTARSSWPRRWPSSASSSPRNRSDEVKKSGSKEARVSTARVAVLNLPLPSACPALRCWSARTRERTGHGTARN